MSEGNASALGKAGERAARKKLEALGYEILENNFRSRMGEIDLVARQNGELVFIEVKTRRQRETGSPAEFVHKTKQRRMARTALAYMGKHNLMDEPTRFDVVSVWGRDLGHLRVDIIQSAFVIE